VADEWAKRAILLEGDQRRLHTHYLIFLY